MSGAIEVEPELADANEPTWATKAFVVRAPRDGLVGGGGKGGEAQQR